MRDTLPSAQEGMDAYGDVRRLDRQDTDAVGTARACGHVSV